ADDLAHRIEAVGIRLLFTKFIRYWQPGPTKHVTIASASCTAHNLPQPGRHRLRYASQVTLVAQATRSRLCSTTGGIICNGYLNACCAPNSSGSETMSDLETSRVVQEQQRRVAGHELLVLFGALPVAYVIIGRLGLLLAEPPGYATAVFLPAG